MDVLRGDASLVRTLWEDYGFLRVYLCPTRANGVNSSQLSGALELASDGEDRLLFHGFSFKILGNLWKSMEIPQKWWIFGFRPRVWKAWSVVLRRKKHLGTLKNVIVAFPQVEFVLLVTKDRDQQL